VITTVSLDRRRRRPRGCFPRCGRGPCRSLYGRRGMAGPQCARSPAQGKFPRFYDGGGFFLPRRRDPVTLAALHRVGRGTWWWLLRRLQRTGCQNLSTGQRQTRPARSSSQAHGWRLRRPAHRAGKLGGPASCSAAVLAGPGWAWWDGGSAADILNSLLLGEGGGRRRQVPREPAGGRKGRPAKRFCCYPVESQLTGLGCVARRRSGPGPASANRCVPGRRGRYPSTGEE